MTPYPTPFRARCVLNSDILSSERQNNTFTDSINLSMINTNINSLKFLYQYKKSAHQAEMTTKLKNDYTYPLIILGELL